MKPKLLTLLALMLCVSAFFLPVTAYAAAADDSQPPSLNAWLEDGGRLPGETLHAEAADRHSGVEAVYVNGHRFGYLVDGAIEVSPLRDYAGKDEYITVHAIDFAGNKSREVKLANPYYTAPATQPPQAQTTPAPDPTPQATTPPAASTPRPSTGGTATPSTSQPSTTPPASSTPEATPTPSPSESALPDGEDNPFTPDGTGSVQDNATDGDGKEFFTIVTEAENTFFLVIDRQRDSEGVYLLNAVTEDDLMALAEKGGSGTSGESAIPTPEPTPQPQPDPTPEPEPEPEKPAENNTGTIIFIIIAALAAGGAGYYFKILRPKQQAALDGDEEDEEDFDDSDYGDEPEDDDEYDFSDDAEFIEDDSGRDGDVE